VSGPILEDEASSGFIKVDVASGGLFCTTREVDFPPGANVRFGKVTYSSGRLRFGLAVFDAYSTYLKNGGVMVLPVHAGFTIWSNPRPFWTLYGQLPDIYMEVSGSCWPLFGGFAPMARAAICCDVDYCGVGARVETGVLANWRYPDYPEKHYSVFIGLQLRVLTFGIGF
jgi:hypothetical protein